MFLVTLEENHLNKLIAWKDQTHPCIRHSSHLSLDSIPESVPLLRVHIESANCLAPQRSHLRKRACHDKRVGLGRRHADGSDDDRTALQSLDPINVPLLLREVVRRESIGAIRDRELAANV
jgi:hypothetical protein